MSRAGTHWDVADMKTAKKLFDQGVDYDAIGALIGRSGMACYDMLRKYYRVSRTAPQQYDGPPIGVTVDCARRRQDAKLGSMVLREACLDLFQRTANLQQLDMDEAMARHLGRHSSIAIPGTERVHKTASVQRLAA